MKKTAKNELRAKSVDALKAEANALRDQLLKTRMAAVAKGDRRLGMGYRAARRQLARLETFITAATTAAAK